MPLIKPEPVIAPVELKVKIEPDVHADLLQYYEFAKGKPGYVVSEMLRTLMKMDKDFQRYLGRDTRAKSRGKAQAA